MNRPFVAVDLETSGLDPNQHEIIEVGLVIEQPRMDGALYDSIVVEQRHFSVPFDEARADPKALEVNGWGTRPFPPPLEPYVAAHYLQEMLADCHLVGKNPQFDVGFLKVLLDRYELRAAWHHRLVDVGMLAWGWHSFGRGPHRLPVWPQPPDAARVADLVGVPWPEAGRHSALVDARWAYDVFRKIVPYS